MSCIQKGARWVSHTLRTHTITARRETQVIGKVEGNSRENSSGRQHAGRIQGNTPLELFLRSGSSNRGFVIDGAQQISGCEMMRANRIKTLLFIGVLSLVVFHLWRDISTRHLNHILQINERRDYSRMEQTESISNVSSGLRCEQNLTAANMTGFETLPAHIKDFLYYKHCRHFPMKLDLPDKCGGADRSREIFLLLVIKSSPVNYERREVLRKTWAKERLHNGVWIRRLFISGTINEGFENDRLNTILELEQREHNDILQWDFNESFFNLTLKQVLFLEWMKRNCPRARFLLNADDDVFANTNYMVEYLQGLKGNDGGRHLFTGHLIEGKGPVRWTKSKYYVPVQVQESEFYPPYCGGGGFLLSGYTAMVIYKMSQSIDLHPIDDVYMGMCLRNAGYNPTSHMAFKTFGLDFRLKKKQVDTFDPCLFSQSLLLVHRFLPAKMYFMWEKVFDPHLKCGAKKRCSRQN